MSNLQRLRYFENNTSWSLESFLQWSTFYARDFGSKDNEHRIYKTYLENISKDPSLIKSRDYETVRKLAEGALNKFEDEVNSVQVKDLWGKCPSFLETLKKAIDLNADKMASRVAILHDNFSETIFNVTQDQLQSGFERKRSYLSEEKSHELQPKKKSASSATKETNDEDYIDFCKKSLTIMNNCSGNKENHQDVILNESIEITNDPESDVEPTDIDQNEKEIMMLTQDETDIRSKLLKILAVYQEKDKKAGKDYLTSIYLNNIIDLSDDEIYNQVKRSLNEDQISWLEDVLRKKTWNPTSEFTEYINQFTEESCVRTIIPTIVRKSCVSGRFDSFYHEAHDIAQHILIHFSLRLEAPMRVEYKGFNLERTYAIDTIIYVLNRIFRMHQDELDVAWIEQITPYTKNNKFDGLYKVISTTGNNQVIIIIEFSRGRKTSMFKKDGDSIKLCRNAMRTLNILLRKIPKERARIYLVQSFNGFFEIKYLIRPLPMIYILQKFTRIKIPATFGDLEQFSRDIIHLMNWQIDVLSTARAINKAATNVTENNNIYITSVNDTPQRKKNQPLPSSPKSPCPGSLLSNQF